jgi:dTMP kinase
MRFVNIEGLDGSGKSTQIKLISEYLESNKIKYKYLHFPRTNSPIYGELVAKFLRGELGDINTVNPYLIALIYAGDRNDAKELINEWISENYLVVIDRYVYSNIAFQCAKLRKEDEIEKLSNWIKYLEFEYHKIPKPDISLYLDVPFEFTKQKLNKSREGDDRKYLQGKEDIHEKDLSFQEKVRAIYLREIEKEPNFERINCTDEEGKILSPKKIRDQIIKYIS